MEKRKKKQDLSSMIYGKVPPQAIELENSILGAMMEDKNIILDVKQIINKNDFYVEANQIICEAIFEISKNSIPDIKLVSDWLKNNGELENTGGLFYLFKLSNSFTAKHIVNIKTYCAIIKQKSIMRKLINISGTILQKAYDDTEDVFDVLLEVQSEVKKVNDELDEIKITPIAETAGNLITTFESKVYNAKNGIIDTESVYTGIKEWDRINGPLFPGLYIIAGRPAMGKGVHMTEEICRMGKETEIGIINGEMTDEQLLKRIGCNLMGIDNFLFKKDPKLVTDEEQEQLREAMEQALNLHIHIENNRYIHKIANKIKLWIEKYGVKVIFADFLTLFKVDDELSKYFTDTQRVNYILNVFVDLCKDYKIPIILYVQMNREILGRSGTKEPNLGDLKQSGSIEELAYQVSFLHRPEYYDKDAVVDEMGENIKGLMYQIIAKHRDGETGRIKFRAELAKSKLVEWEEVKTFNWAASSVDENPF